MLGAGDVGGQEVRLRRGEFGRAGEVGRGPFGRDLLIFADAHADRAGRPQPAGALVGEPLAQCGRARVIEPHAVHQCVQVGVTEHPRLRVARLRERRDRAEFQEAEPEPPPGERRGGVLVHPRREADSIRERKPHQLDGLVDGARERADRAGERARAREQCRGPKREVVGALRLDAEQQRLQELRVDHTGL